LSDFRGVAVLSAENFCAIAAVNDDHILQECLARSPDIAAGRLRIKTIRDAETMALAYNSAREECEAEICLFVHQDVYLPEGWLDRAIELLNGLSRTHPDWAVAGPYGVTGGGRHVGCVWDVTLGRELGGSGFEPTPVGSLDELLLIVRQDSGLRFDPQLPDFHLYGTDIVQTALRSGHGAYAVDLPVVHNNRPIVSLRGGYSRSYRYMRRKLQDRLPISTSICTISSWPFSLWRAQWRRRHVNIRPAELLADAREVAKEAGYE
jgi:hypothetical protein